MQNPTYPVSAAGNALRTLALLHESGEVRVAQVADHLRVARSTAHRVLAMLVFHGFAEQNRTKAYVPGPALRRISGSVPPPDLTTLVRPHLRALAETVRETTHLMVLEGTGTRFLDGVEGPQALRVSFRTGTLLPAHTTSGGKVLLAELPSERLDTLYSGGLPGGGAGVSATWDRLRKELAAARRLGYAVNLQESERGVNAVGTCVRDRSGDAVAAIAVAAPAARCPRARLTELAGPLLAAAAEVSGSL